MRELVKMGEGIRDLPLHSHTRIGSPLDSLKGGAGSLLDYKQSGSVMAEPRKKENISMNIPTHFMHQNNHQHQAALSYKYKSNGATNKQLRLSHIDGGLGDLDGIASATDVYHSSSNCN